MVHIEEHGDGVMGSELESSNIFPCSSYRMKSDQLMIYNAAGKQCVCSSVISPGSIRVSSTLTLSFSNNSL